MSANSVTFDATRITTSEKYLGRLPDNTQLLDSSKQKKDQALENPQNETREVQVVNGLTSATVTFALDKESQELYIQVIDKETGEVLREIPPVEMRKLASALKESFGHLFDLFA